MKYFALLALSLIGLGVTARNPVIKQGKTANVTIDISAIVDSALIMADDYAGAISSNPKMASPRLNAFRTYGKSKPAEVRDSICAHIYDYFVSYTEENKADHARAFKDCFIALADADNPNLGPLYATELTIARANADTTALKEYSQLLETYAARLGYDYDDELAAAQAFLHKMRTRRPLRDAIAGVWVSEDIAGFPQDVRGASELFDEEYPLINSALILQIRETASPVYDFPDSIPLPPISLDSIYRASHGAVANIDVIKFKKNMDGLGTWGTQDKMILDRWELQAHNIAPLDTVSMNMGDSDFFNKINDGYNRLSRKVVIDNDAYSLYTFWGDERLKRGDPEISAMVRQSVQTIQASVAGELSRSNYNFSSRLAGNLTAGLASAGINSLIDAMMVSKERIWSLEITLFMENPYCLDADIFAVLIESSSDSPKPKVREYHHTTRYYRWEMEDDVTFVGTANRYMLQPWTMCGSYFLAGPTKDEKNLEKTKRRDFEQEFKEWYKNEEKSYKTRLKGLQKNSDEYKKLKAEFDVFKDEKTSPKAWIKWNTASLAKLKAKAENYNEN